jgi:serine/threonine-protein kinase
MLLHQVSSRMIMSLFSELRRRKVFRVALIYAVGAWGVLQAMDVLGALAGLPDWTLRAVLVLLVAGFPFAILFSWAFRLSAFRIEREDETPWMAATPAADGEGVSAAAAARRSPVAVVPFRNISGEAQNNYLADGLTHEVLRMLADIGALRVPARHAVCCGEDGRADLRGVAATLPVSHVLQGSVQRTGDSIEVDAELVDVASGEQTWSRAYDGLTGDLVRIAAALAQAAAGALGVPLAGVHRNKRRPVFSTEANTAYLKGRHALNRATTAGCLEAIEHFEVALAAAPTMARAHAGMANAYWWLASYGGLPPDHGYPRARDAAEKALVQDPDLAEAHLALAQVRLRYDWDFAAAEESFRRALQCEPSSAEVHDLYGHFLQMMGQHEQALAMRREAVRLDPLSRSAHRGLADSAFSGGALAEAVRELATIAEYSPDYPIHHLKARIELLQGRPREALDAIRHDPMNWRRLYISAIAYHRLGDSDSYQQALTELIASHGNDAGLQIAIVYAQAGDRDRAFEWLEKAFLQRDPGLIELVSDPELEPLRGDERFRSLEERVGFRQPLRVTSAG